MGEKPKPDPLPVSDPDGYRVPCDTCGALTTDTMLMRCTSCRMRGRDVYE